ncbi:MAG: hypothetical protein WCU88_05690 [Elusimicrobiota bacterium]|jgi:hypothetical protein
MGKPEKENDQLHSLGNKLGTIAGGAQLLRIAALTPGQREDLETIIRAAFECADILADLRRLYGSPPTKE